MFYQLKKEQRINCSIEELWDFTTSPKNLEIITPKSMLFKITSDNANDKVYPGMIITYKVAPILNLQLNWVTEITQVKENKFFIDEQRLGPYKMWHHQHIFEDFGSYVIMRDIITYIPPFGFFGRVINYIIIKNQLNKIFDFRFEAMNKIFNK